MRDLIQILTLVVIFCSCNLSGKKAKNIDSDWPNSQQKSNESDFDEFMEKLRKNESYIWFLPPRQNISGQQPLNI